MFGFLTGWLKWIIGGLALLAFLGGTSCIAAGSMKGGKATVVLRPAIVWKVNTGLYFYGGEDPWLKITDAEIEGSANTKKEADDGS